VAAVAAAVEGTCDQQC